VYNDSDVSSGSSTFYKPVYTQKFTTSVRHVLAVFSSASLLKGYHVFAIFYRVFLTT